MKLTCIMCPMGCEMDIVKKGNNYIVSNNQCKRGETYAIQEITHPERVVTAILKTRNSGVLSVKTSVPIPKEKVEDVMKEINKLQVVSAKIGDVVLENVLGTHADIVVTSNTVSAI